jgi:hypothetical protein
MGGHSGVNKTQNAISKRYYWLSIKSLVNIMITTYYVDLVMDWHYTAKHGPKVKQNNKSSTGSSMILPQKVVNGILLH